MRFNSTACYMLDSTFQGFTYFLNFKKNDTWHLPKKVDHQGCQHQDNKKIPWLFPDFPISKDFLWLFAEFPDFSLTLKIKIFPDFSLTVGNPDHDCSWKATSRYLARGLLKLRSLISQLAEFSILQTQLLDYFNHIHIWHVPPQLSCGDTCQIWTWYSIANVSFGNSDKLGKQRNGGDWLSNPHPWSNDAQDLQHHMRPLLLTWFNFNHTMDK